MKTMRLTRAATLTAAALGLTGCGYVLPTAALAFLGNKGSSGGVVVLRAEDADLVVSRGPQDVGDTTEGLSATVVVMQLRLTATKPTTLRRISFEARGSGDDGRIPVVRLMHDVNGDGLFDAGDVQLGTTSTFSGDDGLVTFDDLDHAFVGGDSLDVLLVITTPSDAAESDEFGVQLSRIELIDAVTQVDGSDRPVGVFGLPVTSGVKTISSTGSLRVVLGPNSPPNAAAFPNSQDLSILQLELRASSAESLRVEQLRLRTSGSGDDLTDVARADLWLDVDADGRLNLAVDQPIVFSAVPQANDGTLVFDGVAQTILPSQIVRWIVVYDLAGSAVDGATFRVDLQAGADMVVQGVTSGQTIVPTGAPISGGATITVNRASLTVDLGPFNPSRTTTPAASDVPALQLRLRAGSAEPVVVTTLGIRGQVGGGDEQNDLGGVSLWHDVDGDGALDAGEPRIAGPTAFSADGAVLTFGGFSRQLAAGSTEFWLVTYDTAPAAQGGDAFTCAASGPTEIAVAGAQSALVVTPQVVTTPGGTLTVTGSLTSSTGPATPGPKAVFSNATDVPVAQVRLTAGLGEAVRVTSLQVQPSGSADDALAVATVELWQDDGDGAVGAGDTLLRSGTFPGNDTALTFSDPAGIITVPASGAVDLLVRYVLPTPAGQALQDQTLRARLDPAAMAAVGVSSGLPIVVGGAPTLSEVVTIRRARLSFATGLQNPGPADVLNGQTDIPVLQVDVTAGPGEDVDLLSIAFVSSGSAVETAVVDAARLYREGTGPKGEVDGTDTLLGGPVVFSADDGQVVFDLSGAPPRFTAGTTSQLLLAYDIKATAPAPGTLTAQLASSADVSARGVQSSPPLVAEVQGLPAVTGGQRTVRRGSLSAAAGAQNPPVGTTFPNAVGRTMLQVELAAGFAEAVLVSQVRLTTAGTADEAAAVDALRLYLDANGDGLVTGGVDTLLASTASVPNDGLVTFSGLSLTVPGGERRFLLAVYDVDVAATPGVTLRLRMADPNADVSAVGLSSNVAIPVAGGPVEGNDQTIVLGSLAASTLATNPTDSVILPKSSSGVPMFQLHLTAGPTESVAVSSLTITHDGTGTPTPAGGVARVRLYRDTNGNGLLDADTLLDETTYAGTTATFTLAPGEVDVAESASLDLLIVYEFNGSAADGQTFRARLAANGDIAATGNSSGVAIVPTGAPLQGGEKTIQTAKLAAAPGAQDGASPTTFFRNEVDVEALQARLDAGPAEAVRVTQLTLQATGANGFDPQAHVSRVRVYREGGAANGLLDADALVVDSPGGFGAGGALVLPVAVGDLDVSAAGTEHLLVVVDVNAPAGGAGGTLRVDLQDLVSEGIVSGLAVTETGTPVTGQARTLKEALLTVSAGPFNPPDGDIAIVGSDVEVLQVRLSAGGQPSGVVTEAVRVSTLTFTADPASTADLDTAVIEARLYRDDDGDGRLGNDLLLNTTTFTGGAATFSPPSGDLDIAAVSSVNVLLVLDVAGSLVDGQTLRVNLDANADVSATGRSSGLPVAVSGAPVPGALKTAQEVTLDVAQTIAPTPDPVLVFDDAAGRVALQLTLATGPLDGVQVRDVTLTASGTADDTGLIARLYLDANKNGSLDAGDGAQLTQQTFTADDGTVTLSLAAGALDVPINETRSVLVLVDLPGTATDGQTYALRVAAPGDVVALGLTSAAPVTIQGPLPVQGRTLQVQSTTLSLTEPAQVPATFELPNARDVPFLRFGLQAGALEGVRVTGLTLRPTGASTGADGPLTLRLYRDVNGNGTLEGGIDVLLATVAGDDAAVVVSNPAGVIDIPASGLEQVLVTLDFGSPAPAPGDAFDLSVAAADVVAEGLGSGAPVNGITGGPFTGGLKTVHQGTLTIATGAQNPVAADVFRGQTRVVQQARLTATVEPVELTRVAVQDLGPSAIDTVVDQVRLYRDDNGNGVLDGDTLLGQTTFSSGVATFQPGGVVVIVQPGTPVDLLVVYAFNATGADGAQFQAGDLVAADIDARGGASTVTITPTGTGAAGGALTYRVGRLDVAPGPVTLVDRDVVRGQTNVAAAQVRLTATSEPARVDVVAFDLTGVPGVLAGAELWHDQDGNGALSGSDVLLGNGTLAGSRVTFDATGVGLVNVSTVTPVDALLIFDFNLTGADGQTIEASGPALADVSAVGVPSGLAVGLTGPGGGAGHPTLTVRVGALAFNDGPNQPAGGDVFLGQSGVVLRQLRAVASGEPVVVNDLQASVSGQTGGVASLVLWHDRNGDGALDPGDVQLASAAGTSVTFSGAGGLVTVQPGTPVDLLVTATMGAGGGADGDAFALALPAPAALVATGATSGLAVSTTVSNGASIGFTLQVATLALSVGDAPPASRTVYAGQAGVPVQQVKLTATDEPARLASLRVGFANGGTGGQSSHVAAVHVYVDENANGALDADTLLASGDFMGGASVLLAPAGGLVTVPANASRHLLVVYDFGAGGATGFTYGADAVDPADVAATGAIGGVTITPTGSTPAGAQMPFAEGELALALGPAQPPARTVGDNEVGAAVRQLQLTATGEAVRLDQLTLTLAAGGGGAATDLAPSGVRLFLDANANGALDADTPLAAGDYGAGGALTFSSATGLVTVPTSAPVQLLLVYDFGATAPSGSTFGVQDVAAADLVARGAASGLLITATGSATGASPLTFYPRPAVTVTEATGGGAGAVSPRQADVVMLDLTLTETTNRDDAVLTSLTVEGLGTGIDDADVVQLELWEDDGDGVLDAGDARRGVTAYFADPGVATFGALSLTVPGGGSLRLFVTYDMASPPAVAAGATFQAQLQASGLTLRSPSPGDLAVVPTGAFPLLGIERTATAADDPVVTVTQTLATGPGPFIVYGNETGRPVLALTLQETGGQQAAVLTSLTVEGAPAGTGDDATDVSFVRLFRDLGTIGVFDAGVDQPIGLSAYFADPGTAVFAGLNETVPAGGSRAFLVTYDMSDGSQVSDGETYQAQVPPSGVALKGAVSGLAVTNITGLPVAGPMLTGESPRLTVQQLALAPDPLTVRRQTNDHATLRLRFTANPVQDVVVQAIEVQSDVGGGDDATEVAAITLYRDVNADGVIDASDVEVARSTSPFSADGGAATLGGLAETIPRSGTPVEYLVALDVGSANATTDTFRASIVDATRVTASAGVQRTLTPTPATGRLLQVGPGVTVAEGPYVPSSEVMNAPPAETAMILLELTADDVEDVTVTAITLTASGSANDADDVTDARLYVGDADAAFEPGAGDTLSVGPIAAPFAADDGAVTLTLGAALTIPKGTTARLWCSLAVAQQNGQTVRLSFADDAHLAAGAAFVTGADITGPTFFTSEPIDIFEPAATVPLLGTSRLVLDLELGDLDRDGDLDLLILRQDSPSPRLETYWGDGAGAFPTSTSGPAAAGMTRLALGDLDRDGDLDAVAAAGDTVHVFRYASGTNTFALDASYVVTGALVPSLFDLTVVDFDRDHHLDIVVTDRANDALRGLVGSSTGALTLGGALSTTKPRRIMAADVNGDGSGDVLWTTDADGTELKLALNDGASAFYPAISDAEPIGAGAGHHVVADLDRNGRPDVLVVDENSQELNVIEGLGGSLAFSNQAATDAGYSAPDLPRELVAGDWDGDGRADAAIVHASGHVVVHLGDGTLVFPMNTNLATPPVDSTAYATTGLGSPDLIVAGDLNRDGDPDLVVASTSVAADLVVVLLGDGETNGGVVVPGTPTRVDWTGGGSPVGVTTGDFDRDGDPDYAVVGQNSKAVALYLNDGDGAGFTKSAQLTLTNSGDRVRAVDLNRDGRLDLVTSIRGGSDDRLTSFLGNGDGTFQGASHAQCLDDADPLGLDIADLNEDGSPDAVVAETKAKQLQLFRGTGTGFQDAQAGDRRSIANGATPIDIAFVDVDRDGTLDVLVLTHTPAQLQVFLGTGGFGLAGAASATDPIDATLGTPSAFALGDIDRDGIHDVLVVSSSESRMQAYKGRGTISGGSAFVAQTSFVSVPAVDVTLADMDKDGRLDIVAMSNVKSEEACVTHRLSIPATFGFLTSISRPTLDGGDPYRVATADFNRDGDLDVIAPMFKQNSVQIFSGQ